jgi:hypothetical protein
MSTKEILLKHLDSAGGNAVPVRKLQTWVSPDLGRVHSSAELTLMLEDMQRAGWVTSFFDNLDKVTLWLITQQGKTLLLSRVNE